MTRWSNSQVMKNRDEHFFQLMWPTILTWMVGYHFRIFRISPGSFTLEELCLILPCIRRRTNNATRGCCLYTINWGGRTAKPPKFIFYNIVIKWAERKWREWWECYLNAVPIRWGKQAHGRKLGRDKPHQGLRKAGSPLATQLRTEKIGFVASLHDRRVPRWSSRPVSVAEDDIRLIVKNHIERQEQTDTNKSWVQAKASRWSGVMREGLLGQCPLAKEQVDKVEGRVIEDGERPFRMVKVRGDENFRRAKNPSDQKRQTWKHVKPEQMRDV